MKCIHVSACFLFLQAFFRIAREEKDVRVCWVVFPGGFGIVDLGDGRKGSGRMDKTDEREAVVWAVLQNKRLAQELERVREERDLYQAWWRQAIRKEGEGDVRARPADPL